MNYILSLTTTPERIDCFLNQLPFFNREHEAELVIINICNYYKRKDKHFKLNKRQQKQLNFFNRFKLKYVFNICNDYGAITKYKGGIEYMKRHNIKNKYLIIIDDDIFYKYGHFDKLIDHKTNKNITTGNGFNFGKEWTYEKRHNEKCDMVEGFSGICFDSNQVNNLLLNFIDYMKCVDFNNDDNIINQYLKACCLGDDFILSYQYKKKLCVNTNKINIYRYGLGEDALHKNNIFGDNMKTYKFLNDNILILKTFYNKILLNKHFIKTSRLGGQKS